MQHQNKLQSPPPPPPPSLGFAAARFCVWVLRVCFCAACAVFADGILTADLNQLSFSETNKIGFHFVANHARAHDDSRCPPAQGHFPDGTSGNYGTCPTSGVQELLEFCYQHTDVLVITCCTIPPRWFCYHKDDSERPDESSVELCADAGFPVRQALFGGVMEWVCDNDSETSPCAESGPNRKFNTVGHYCGCEGTFGSGKYNQGEPKEACGCQYFQSWFALPGQPRACVPDSFLDIIGPIMNDCTAKGYTLRGDGDNYYCTVRNRNTLLGGQVFDECLIVGPGESESFNLCSAVFGTPLTFPQKPDDANPIHDYAYCRPGTQATEHPLLGADGTKTTCLETELISIFDECKTKGWFAYGPMTGDSDWGCVIPVQNGESDVISFFCRFKNASGDDAPDCARAFGAPVVFPQKPEPQRAYFYNCPNGELPERIGCAPACGSGERLIPDPLGLDRCVVCAEGVGRNGECEPCPDGTAPTDDHSACVVCPVGYEAADDGGGCESCPLGAFRGAENERCVPCPFGKIPNEARSGCLAVDSLSPDLAGVPDGADFFETCHAAGWETEERGHWLTRFYSFERYDICKIPLADGQVPSRRHEYCVMSATNAIHEETDTYMAAEWDPNTHDFDDIRCDVAFGNWKTYGFPRKLEGRDQRFVINCPGGGRAAVADGTSQVCTCDGVSGGSCGDDRRLCLRRAATAGLPSANALAVRGGVEHCLNYTYSETAREPGGSCVLGVDCDAAFQRDAYPCALGGASRVANANNDGCEICSPTSVARPIDFRIGPRDGGRCSEDFAAAPLCRTLGGEVVAPGGGVSYFCRNYNTDGGGECLLGTIDHNGIPVNETEADDACARTLPPDCGDIAILNANETACVTALHEPECLARGGAISGERCVNFKPAGDGECLLGKGGKNPAGCERAFADGLRTCGANEIISADNLTCQTCPSGRTPTANKRDCQAAQTGCQSESVCASRRVECAAREGRLVWGNDGLEYCEGFLLDGTGRCRVASHGSDECAAAFRAASPCRANEYSDYDGGNNTTTCRTCAAGQVPNHNRTGCVADTAEAELAECEHRTGRPRRDFRRDVRGDRLGGALGVSDFLCEGYTRNGGGLCRIGVSDAPDGCADSFSAEARPCPPGSVADAANRSCKECPLGQVPDTAGRACVSETILETQSAECSARDGRVFSRQVTAGAARHEYIHHLCADFRPQGDGECRLGDPSPARPENCAKQFADYARPCPAGFRRDEDSCVMCPYGETDPSGKTCALSLADICQRAGWPYQLQSGGREVCKIPTRDHVRNFQSGFCVMRHGSFTTSEDVDCHVPFPDWRETGFPTKTSDDRHYYTCPPGVTTNVARNGCTECETPLTVPLRERFSENVLSCSNDHAAMRRVCESSGWRWLNHGDNAARYDVCAVPLRDAETQAVPGVRTVRGEELSYCVMHRGAALDKGDVDCDAALPDWRTDGFPQSQGEDDSREFVFNCPHGATESYEHCAGSTADCEARGWTVANGVCKGAFPGGECETGAACVTAALRAESCEAVGGAATATECAGIDGGGRCALGADCDEVYENYANGCPPNRRLAEGRCVAATNAAVATCATQGGSLGAMRDGRGVWRAHCVFPPQRFGGARASCPLANNGCANDYIALATPPTCRPDQTLQPKSYTCGCPPGMREFDLGDGPQCLIPYDCSHTPLENDEANATNNGCACPYDFPYVGYYTDRCVTICSAEQEVYDGMCSPRCQEDEFRNPNGTCECRRF